MDASVLQHIKEVQDILRQSNISNDLYKIIDYLLSAIAIQERNISTLEKRIEHLQALNNPDKKK
jgi:hypothetical protein